MRVYSSDIKASGGAMADQNVISDMRIKTSGSYTTVTLDMTQKVPYKVEYDGSRLVFRFQYTAETPVPSMERASLSPPRGMGQIWC